MHPPVLFINRDADADRRESFLDACLAHGVAARRVRAVDREDAAALRAESRLLPEAFWEEEEIKPGAFACFLSHRRAWLEVAASAAPWSLVCEDDARLEADGAVLSAHAGQAARMGLHLLWCGARACAQAAEAAAEEGEFVDAACYAAARAGSAGRAPPGAEALLMSRAGARRLLALTAEDRCCAGVDWLLLFRCWDSRVGEGRGEMAALRRMLGPSPRRLRAAIAPDPLAGLAAGPSVLRHRERMAIAALRAAG